MKVIERRILRRADFNRCWIDSVKFGGRRGFRTFRLAIARYHQSQRGKVEAKMTAAANIGSASRRNAPRGASRHHSLFEAPNGTWGGLWIELTCDRELPVQNFKGLGQTTAFLLELVAAAQPRVGEEAGFRPRLSPDLQPRATGRPVDRTSSHDREQFDELESATHFNRILQL